MERHTLVCLDHTQRWEQADAGSSPHSGPGGHPQHLALDRDTSFFQN